MIFNTKKKLIESEFPKGFNSNYFDRVQFVVLDCLSSLRQNHTVWGIQIRFGRKRLAQCIPCHLDTTVELPSKR